jgi:hypothetical protein
MANYKITQLPSASIATGSNVLPIVQGGVTDQITVTNLGQGILNLGLSMTGSLQGTSSYAVSASYTPTLQQVLNSGAGAGNYGAVGSASIQLTNFVNGRTLYINNNSFPTIKMEDNNDAANNLTIDLNTLVLDNVSYNWSDIVSNTSSFALTASSINPLVQNVLVTGSVSITGSGFLNGSNILTSADTGSFYTTGSFGFYGAFCSTASQSNPVADISRSMALETTELSDGISIVSGSRITVANAGIYNLEFSAQLEKTTNGVGTVYIWFKKNGSNVARSATAIDVVKQAGGSGKNVAAWNYIDNYSVGDYVEVVWQSSDITMQLAYDVAAGNIPVTPSIIVTLTQVS